MKKVLALAAILAVFTVVSFADDLSIKNLKTYGEGSIIGLYENDDYAAGKGQMYSNVYSQLLLGVSFDLNKNVQGAVAVGYESWWGENGLDGKSAIKTPAPSNNNVNNDLNNGQGFFNQLRIVEANLTLNKFLDINGLKVKVGRQFYGDEDSAIMYLGVRHYHAEKTPLPIFLGLTNNKITSIDALTGYYEKGNVKADAIYGVVANPDVIGGGGGGKGAAFSKSIAILGAKLKYSGLMKKKVNVEAYVYELDNANLIPGSVIQSEGYGIYGIKPEVNIDDLKASLEIAQNYGAKTGGIYYVSNMIKLDASYNLNKFKLNTRGAYVLIGGHDENYNMDKTFYNAGNYRPGLIFGNEYFIIGNNQKIINLGADYKLKKYMFSLDYYNDSQRDGSTVFGEEVDLFVKYKYAENVEVFLGIGHMFTEDGFNGNQDISKGLLGITYKIM